MPFRFQSIPLMYHSSKISHDPGTSIAGSISISTIRCHVTIDDDCNISKFGLDSAVSQLPTGHEAKRSYIFITETGSVKERSEYV